MSRVSEYCDIQCNQSAKDLGDSGRDNSYGYGLVQAKAAHDYICDDICTNGYHCVNGDPFNSGGNGGGGGGGPGNKPAKGEKGKKGNTFD